MNVCIPVNRPENGASPVCAHFGSAPAFVIANTEAGTYRSVTTGGQHMCGAIGTLQKENVASIIVGGIGMGALNRLAAAGIQVFAAQHATVDENLAALKAGQLPLMSLDGACASHGHGHGHGDGDGHGHGPGCGERS
ncbi:MAG TPA: NifB/NifX family molybdenum-iron cluster-binding protein [Polyangia bacterium]|nr:NifB/NifX family molybdenum-iron cluster-binding protein [Polyangia bacterium]